MVLEQLSGSPFRFSFFELMRDLIELTARVLNIKPRKVVVMSFDSPRFAGQPCFSVILN